MLSYFVKFPDSVHEGVSENELLRFFPELENLQEHFGEIVNLTLDVKEGQIHIIRESTPRIIPKDEIIPREPLFDDEPDGYMESDRDFVMKNIEVAVDLLEKIYENTI